MSQDYPSMDDTTREVFAQGFERSADRYDGWPEPTPEIKAALSSVHEIMRDGIAHGFAWLVRNSDVSVNIDTENGTQTWTFALRTSMNDYTCNSDVPLRDGAES